MPPLRIFLGPMPEMLRTIVNDLLSREADIVMVGASAGSEDPLRQAQSQGADVLITEDLRHDGSCLGTVVSGRPLSIFVIGSDGQEAATINLARKRVGLSSGTQTALAEALRRVAAEAS